MPTPVANSCTNKPSDSAWVTPKGSVTGLRKNSIIIESSIIVESITVESKQRRVPNQPESLVAGGVTLNKKPIRIQNLQFQSLEQQPNGQPQVAERPLLKQNSGTQKLSMSFLLKE